MTRNGARPLDVSHASSVCAIVVTYFPDSNFNNRLLELLPQVDLLVIVDNTPAQDGLASPLDTFAGKAQVHLIRNQANAGISTALNQGLAHARSTGCKWILTLDQDTLCYHSMVETLLAVSRRCDPAPGVVGGNYLDPRSGKFKVPLGESGEFLEQTTVITSGSLIDTEEAVSAGGFRDDYFIDQVDHEFCLRMRARGHKVVISRKPVMAHSVGEPGGVRLPFLGVLPRHPPLRKYYIARNTVVTVLAYWRREPQWCLRRLARLVLGLGGMAILEQHRLSKVLAFAAGVVDGLRGRMGPCQREAILKSNSNLR